MIYGATFTLTAIFYYLLWWYPTHDRRLVLPETPQATLDAVNRRFRIGAPIYFAASLLALFSPALSLGVFLALALFYIVPGALWGT